MVQHVAIRREDYVGGTRARPEVGIFTQTHSARRPVPWDHVNVGELVWMKWSGGPIVATARIEGFRQIANCSPEQLRNTTSGYGLYDLTSYWSSLQPVFFGMTIYLTDERWLDHAFIPQARSRGESWIVLRTPEQEQQWLTRVTEPTARDSTGRDRATRRGSRTVPLTLRFEVLRRGDFRCAYCGRDGRK